MSVGVVIATYGDFDVWGKLADRAEESVRAQTIKADNVVRIHGKTLAQARNEGVAQLGTTDAVILDADDLLTPEYIERMIQAEGTLRYPMVGRIYPNGRRELIKYEPRNLLERNFLVIGSMFKTEDFLTVGGFDSQIEIFEDWDVWLSLQERGAVIAPSQSVYVHNVNPNGRNSGIDVDITYWYNFIRNKHIKTRGDFSPLPRLAQA